MTVKISLGAALLLVIVVLMCAGCAPMEGTTTANPVARIQIEPLKGVVKMESSRDDKASLGSLEAKIPENAPGPLAGTTLTVTDLDLDASASKVRKANVGQITGMGEFNMDTGQAWGTVIDSMGNTIVSPVMGRLYPNTGAEIAKTFSYLFLIVVVCAIVAGAVIAAVLFGKLWRWAFPPKDATQALLVELMRANTGRSVQSDNGTAGK